MITSYLDKWTEIMNEQRISCQLQLKKDDFIMQNHHVHDVSLMPGVTFLDIVLRVLEAKGIGFENVTITDVLFYQAIATGPGIDKNIAVNLEPESENRFRITGKSQNSTADDTAHWEDNFTAKLDLSSSVSFPTFSIAKLKAEANVVRNNDEVYRIAKREGIVHGDQMKSFGQMYIGDNYLFAELNLAKSAEVFSENFVFHPATLDGSTLLAYAWTEFDPGEPFIPVYIEEFAVLRRPQGKCAIYVPEKEKLADSKDIISNSYYLVDETGQAIAYFKNLTCKRIRQSQHIQKLLAETTTTTDSTTIVSQELPSDGVLVKAIKEEIATILKTDAVNIPLDKGFYDLGLDSTDLLQLSESIESLIEHKLYPTLLFEHNTIQRLVTYLDSEFEITLLTEVTGEHTEEQNHAIETLLLQLISEKLSVESNDINVDEGFYQLGLDSADLLNLRAQLEEVFNQPLYPTLLFEYSNVKSLAEFLKSQFSTEDNFIQILSEVATETKETPSNAKLVRFTEQWQRTPYLPTSDNSSTIAILDCRRLKSELEAFVNPNKYVLLSVELERLREQLDRFFASRQIPSNLVVLFDSEIEATEAILACYGLSKFLVSSKPVNRYKIKVLYRETNSYQDCSFEAIASFARTVAKETPDIQFSIVGDSLGLPAARLETYLHSEFEDSEVGYEPAVRYTSKGRVVKRFAREREIVKSDHQVTSVMATHGVYVIAGAGAIGMHIANYLMQELGATVVFIGRKSSLNTPESYANQWQRNGNSVHYVQADILDYDNLNTAFVQIREQWGAIAGIIHTAGVIADGLHFLKTSAQVKRVVKVKTEGLVNLDKVTSRDNLSVFIACSSLSANFANIGQSDYAFANGFMESFCRIRAVKKTGKSLAIGWPYWADGGMQVLKDVLQRTSQTTGLIPLPTPDALNALEVCLSSESPCQILTYGDEAQLDLILGPAPESKAIIEEVNRPNTSEDSEIAIVGVAGQYPGARNIEQFWENLKSGHNAIRALPESRWEHDFIFSPRRGEAGKTYSRWGGFIDNIEFFDAEFFGISRKEAELMDPQERLFLRTCYEALENGTYSPRSLSGSQIGVFAGVMWNHYQQVTSEFEASIPTAIHASVANRVSHCLNLTGPSLTVDTMCSSSLTAVHLACESIRRGECRMALAGGVNVITHPAKYLQLSQSQFLSDDGLCKSFGEGGTGYVPGEGVGVIVLKSLADAEKNGDNILGVIKTSYLNHSGKTSGYTVPSPSSQADLISEALARSGLTPDSIGYIEAHGTGTSLGDPIEIEGIRQAFSKFNSDTDSNDDKCKIGSVKSNIGHLESAAGIAGISKVLLQIQHKTLVPSIHTETLNPQIDFDRAPVSVQTQVQPWQPINGAPLRAGVSAFGAGGSNVHVVIEQYQKEGKQDSTLSGPVIVALSGRSAKVLKQQAEQLVSWLVDKLKNQSTNTQRVSESELIQFLSQEADIDVDRESIAESFEDLGVDGHALLRLQTKIEQRFGNISVKLNLDSTAGSLLREINHSTAEEPISFDLQSLAYSIQVGRDAMPTRLVVITQDLNELIHALRDFIADRKYGFNAKWDWSESADSPSQYPNIEPQNMAELSIEECRKLAFFWQQGGEVEWQKFYSEKPARIALPNYPFDEQPYWLGRWKGIRQGLLSEDAPLISLESADEKTTTQAEKLFIDTSDRTDSLKVPLQSNVENESSIIESVEHYIATVLAEILYLDQGEIDIDKSFSDMGLESTGVVELVEQINSRYSMALEAVSVFDYSSIKQLAQYIVQENKGIGWQNDHILAQDNSTQKGNSPHSPIDVSKGGHESDIAIIGMAGRFSGASDVNEYWENLSNGHSSISPVSENRWPLDSYYDPSGTDPLKIGNKWAALLDDVASFDSGVFQISPLIAKLMDPQQRIFLEESWRALEDAGYAVRTKEKQNIGVFVGCAVGDYVDWLMASGKGNTGEAFLGLVPSILASRISYHLNFCGPAIAVDTACSSSLVSVHMACDSIRSGDCEVALAGGVALMLTPQLQIRSSQMGILSDNGHCSPFDEKANGTVLGEGAGVVVLKSLSKAIEDGDHIHAVIHGSGINNDGKSNGITAPSGESQEMLMNKVLSRAQLTAEDIGYIEAHGTGTNLGDPIEVNALKNVYGKSQEKRVGLGSVKSNIGHTTMAAGIAGLLKSLMAIKHRQLPPSLNYSKANAKIDFSESPIFVVEKKMDWVANDQGRLISSISSFGFSGTNACVILGSPPPQQKTSFGESCPTLILLSANDEQALERRVVDLEQWLKDEPDVSLGDIAYTLARGRTHFRYRLALVANDKQDLSLRLGQINRTESFAVLRSHAAEANEKEVYPQLKKGMPSPELIRWGLEQLAIHYMQGGSLRWEFIPGLDNGRKVSLPGYVFTKHRHWIDSQSNKAASSESSTFNTQHPVPQDFHSEEKSQHRRSKMAQLTFGQHVFINNYANLAETDLQNGLIGDLQNNGWLLEHHIVNGKPTLPGVVSLEMAVASAMVSQKEAPVTLSKVKWQMPILGKPQRIALEQAEEQAFRLVLEESNTAYVEGRVVNNASYTESAAKKDIQAIKQRCSRQIDSTDIYTAFSEAGIEYGDGYRNLKAIYCGDNEAVGEIQLSEFLHHPYFMHPGILDAAFQSISQLHGRSEVGPAVPYMLEELTYIQPLNGVYSFAYIKKTGRWTYDIEVLNQQGELCVACKGFLLRPLGTKSGSQMPAENHSYVAEWIEQPKVMARLLDENRVVIISPEVNHPLGIAISALYSDALVLNYTTFQSKLNGLDVDAVYFIGSSEDGLNDSGVFQAYKATKLLLASNARNAINVTFVSEQTLKVKGSDQVNVSGAGLVGLSQAIAAEYPLWNVKIVDVSTNAMFDVANTALTIVNEPQISGLIAIRDGKRYGRRFKLESEYATDNNISFQQGGCYLIVGGAGGIGFEVGKYLAQTYSANVLLLGRRQIDESIRNKLEDIRRRGGTAYYIQASITDQTALSKSIDTCLTENGLRLDGAIHAGGIFNDMSMLKMGDDDFKRVIAPKLQGVSNLAQTLSKYDPKFLLLFSSAASFVETPGQANYAAASTFEDAIGHYLQTTQPYRTRVINWGYWGSVGAVSDPSYQRRMNEIGLWSIEPTEAMNAMEQALRGEQTQRLIIKAAKERLQEWFGIIDSQREPRDMPALIRSRSAYCELEKLGQMRVVTTLIQRGWLPEQGGVVAESAIKLRLGGVKYLWPLFSAILEMAERAGYIERNNGLIKTLYTLNNFTDISDSFINDYPDMSAHLNLLTTCVDSLPAMFNQTVKGTDILFPKGSVELVQGIYKGQPIANYYNEIVAIQVKEQVSRLNQTEQRRVRVLEIGAGTGGTSAFVLPALAGLDVEYCYTDVSSAFLAHGKTHYLPKHPFMKFQLLDIEKPLEEQGFDLGSYDIVLATMVLHVAKDMQTCVNNISKLLKIKGIVIINEVTQRYDFLTLTFGLLQDWWAFNDSERRIAHTPILSPANWQSLLENGGFDNTQISGIPGTDGQALEQCIISAAYMPPEANIVSLRSASLNSIAQPASQGLGKKQEMIKYLSSVFANVLNYQEQDIGADDTFEQFGIDSLVGQTLTARLEQDFGELPATLLFEYLNISQLADFFMTYKTVKMKNLFGEMTSEQSRLSESESSTQLDAVTSDSETNAFSISTGDILQYLISLFAQVLECDESLLDEHSTFESFGIDSLVGQQVISRLEKDVGDLPATLLFEHLTLNELALYMQKEKLSELMRLIAPSTQVIAKPASENIEAQNTKVQEALVEENEQRHESLNNRNKSDVTDIAIIGLSGRYPQANNLETFWQKLASGTDLVGDLPKDRKDWHPYVEAGMGPGPAAFLDNIDEFDPAPFNILPKDAVNIDPQERLFLETSWELLASTGYLGKYRKQANTGVFVGSMYAGYGQLAATRWNEGLLTGPHSAHWSLANRVSYTFDLQGPSFCVDSACSSSLTAVHLACESLRRGECNMAIAGGVNVILHPAHFASLNALKMLSPQGRSKTFDESADGFAPGEGVGAVLLKPLRQAEKDNDQILGIIKASSVNAGGKTAGYTVPNPNAQSHLVAEALERSGVHPRTISYVEAHGTGTSLGDPIEIAGLSRAYKGQTKDTHYCAIGSVKSNLGHLEGAAGIVGLTKVLLQLKHKQLAPNVHLNKLNPKIDFANSPFKPQDQLTPWETQEIEIDGVKQVVPRRAGISSFGAGGANTHLIVEEYVDRRLSEHNRKQQLILLSAKSKNDLMNLAKVTKTYLESEAGQQLDIASLAYSSQLGRIEMSARLAILADDVPSLLMTLNDITQQRASNLYWQDDLERFSSDVSIFNDEVGSTFIQQLLDSGSLKKLAQMWVRGIDVDWRMLWQDERPKICAFPSYVFNRKRFWLDIKAPEANTGATKNTVMQQGGTSSESAFTESVNIVLEANAYYCKGHRINNETWLPGVYYFELCRQHLDCDLRSDSTLTFKDVKWVNPVRMNASEKTIELELVAPVNAQLFRFSDGNNDDVLCVGSVLRETQQIVTKDLAAIKRSCSEPLNVSEFYARLNVAGLNHDTSFQSVSALWLGDKQLLVRLDNAEFSAVNNQSIQIVPSLLDGALQAVAALDDSDLSYIPSGIRHLSLFDAIDKPAWVHITEVTADDHQTGKRLFNLTVFNDEQIIIGEMKGLEIAINLLNSKKAVPKLANKTKKTSKEHIESRIRDAASQFLLIGKEEIDLDAELLELGFDSVSITELLEEVNQIFELQLMPQVLFDHPTLRSFAVYLSELDVFATSNDLAEDSSYTGEVVQPSQTKAKKASVNGESALQTSAKAKNEFENRSNQDIETIALSLLKEKAARFLMVQGSEVDLNAELLEMGFDSVSLVELLEDINLSLNLSLTPQMLFDCPTLYAIAEFLLREHREALNTIASFETSDMSSLAINSTYETELEITDSAAARNLNDTSVDHAPIKQQLPPVQDNQDIAIIGVGGIFPQSDDLSDFWENLANDRDLIAEVPSDRTDILADSYLKNMKAGFVERIAEFDAKFFKVSPAEVTNMDPQQRLFMEVVWRTVNDAGYRISDFAGSETGLFAGVSTTDYNDLMSKHGVNVEAHTATGIAHSILANRVSYMFDLQGPSEVVDTACSSSLVAIHRAVTAIKNGECSTAIAGGVNALLGAGLFSAFSQSGMLSPDYKCKTFDKSANGYVRGEGVGAILLKPYSQALSDGDDIYAVIKGSAVNHGGRTNSLTAPSPTAQSRVIQKAYKNAHIDPKTVSYIEAHGTGTQLGDPVEIEGLKIAMKGLYAEFGHTFSEGKSTAIGSVKTNIGHLEAAAGIAGIIKVLLAMKHKVLPSTLNFQEENPYLNLEQTPFYVQQQTEHWKAVEAEDGKMVRRAGVSAFGFGGTNAHIVLQAVGRDAAVSDSPQSSKNVFLLSAPTPEALNSYVDLITRCLQNNLQVDLKSLANTLMYGKKEEQYRVAFVATNHEELMYHLGQYAQGQSQDYSQWQRGDQANFFPSNVTGRQIMQWLNGDKVSWPTLVDGKVKRVNGIPSFPLQLKRFWFQDVAQSLTTGDSLEAGNSKNVFNSSEHKMNLNEAIIPTSKSNESNGKVTLSQVFAKPGQISPPTSAAVTLSHTPDESITQQKLQKSTSVHSGENQVSTGQASVSAFVAATLSDLLGLPVDEVSHEQDFVELGLDSIFGIQFIRKINEMYETEILAADVYEFSTVQALTEHILSMYPETVLNDTQTIPEPETVVELEVTQESLTEPAEREKISLSQIKQMVFSVTSRELAQNAVFSEYISSFEMLRLVAEIEKVTGPIRKTILFENNTIEKLARFINGDDDGVNDAVIQNETLSTFSDSVPSDVQNLAPFDVEHDKAESHIGLKIAEILSKDIEVNRTFEEQLSSFEMLKAVSGLEQDFGPLRKSLLFDCSTLPQLEVFLSSLDVSNKQQENRKVHAPCVTVNSVVESKQPIVIPKRTLPSDKDLQRTIDDLLLQFGKEGGLPGRDIAPLIFLGSSKKGFFNFTQNHIALFSFSYVGSEEYLPEIAREYVEYAQQQGIKANFNSLIPIDNAQGIPFTSTPFGVLQRFVDLPSFTLKGQAMRKLRYLVNKFSKSAKRVETSEYAVGSDANVDLEICEVIENWASGKKMTNPYVHRVKKEISNGILGTGHRMFLTRLDGRLSNAIIITKIPSENGYLLDLEFYDKSEPIGGLEFAIVEIFERLIEEKCDMFSFGGTFGVVEGESDNADSNAVRELEDLKTLGLINNDGNVQFKNKFRTTNATVYLCRPDEPDATSVSDILLTIANPQLENVPVVNVNLPGSVEEHLDTIQKRSKLLQTLDNNLIRLQSAEVDFDFISDSWTEQNSSITYDRMRFLREQVNRSTYVEKPFWLPTKFAVATSSGKEAETALCKALPTKGSKVLNNGLFPSWNFSLLDKGLSPAELELDKNEPVFGANVDVSKLREYLVSDHDVAFICLELNNNSLGGAPLSLSNLQQVKLLADENAIPLVLDATRLMENAIAIQQYEAGYKTQSVQEIAIQIINCCHSLTMSLSKDYGLNFGGLVATHDEFVGEYLNEQISIRGHWVNAESRKLISYAVNDFQYVEAQCRMRIENVSLLAEQLTKVDLPFIKHVCGHCLIVDVSKVSLFDAPEFVDSNSKQRVDAFLYWLYINTGVRAAKHLNQQYGKYGETIRVAIPLGLSELQIEEVAARIQTIFKKKTLIPFLKETSNSASPLLASFDILAPAKPKLDSPDEYRQMVKTAANAAERPKDANYLLIKEKAPKVGRKIIPLDNAKFEVFVIGKGKPLLLMHPFNIGAGLFAEQFSELGKHFKVICIHHPGVGETESLQQLSLDTIADQYQQILKKLHIRHPIHVVGASAGGLQAQVFVQRHRKLCCSLTLICSSYKVGNRDGKVSPLIEVIEEDFAKIEQKVESKAVINDKSRFVDILLRCESMDPKTGLRYIDELANLPNLKEKLAEIDIPCLVLQGSLDSVIDEEVTQHLVEKITGAKLIKIETAGHFPTLTHARECNTILADFVLTTAQIHSVENMAEEVEL
ncbi:SDR family NAD(P)-dependent oxidoreductase [Endozoicomonas sp. G2_1]|uniref:SDR family NAD(P)-dependent oxidoreductase n=1 Tax=Endozoicomonas sp. G2_1 TaxID=2821091 RepID=UPI001ADCFA6F|nr:SDR family NAD(P)-dependent oxidoreductase [Endozoicomonas sp. G2_1]MBO9489818.1 SDR family NAD(P)-dependent oxidoreductase [Endozoicomonas sp. G2_1]